MMILKRMNADELREMVKHQEDAITAYQEMNFVKDEVIKAQDALYRRRVDMEEARIRYEVATANLRYFDDKMAEKYDDRNLVTCEGRKDGDGDG